MWFEPRIFRIKGWHGFELCHFEPELVKGEKSKDLIFNPKTFRCLEIARHERKDVISVNQNIDLIRGSNVEKCKK